MTVTLKASTSQLIELLYMFNRRKEPFNKLELLDLREAFSPLKVQYYDLKEVYRHQLEEIDNLKRELEDYRKRYDHLI